MKVLFISPARFTSLSRQKQHLRSKVSHHRRGHNHSKKILNGGFCSGSAKPLTEDKASQCQHLRCKPKRPMCCPILVAKNLAGKVWNGWPIGLWCTLPKPFHKAVGLSIQAILCVKNQPGPLQRIKMKMFTFWNSLLKFYWCTANWEFCKFYLWNVRKYWMVTFSLLQFASVNHKSTTKMLEEAWRRPGSESRSKLIVWYQILGHLCSSDQCDVTRTRYLDKMTWNGGMVWQDIV